MSERAAKITPPDEQHDEQPNPDTAAAADDDQSTPVTTGAEAVVRALENAGVEYAFGVQGGAIMPVYDALYDSDIRHVTMAHEQGAAHAADAYGIVSGDPGVCLATSGPGATNLVTGLADADMDSDPLVALTGQVPTAFVGNDAFQETDTTGVTTPITKDNTFASDPGTVGDDVGEAFALAGEGRPGPTLVDLPKDVTKAETKTAPGEPETPETDEYQDRADPEIVEAAAEWIENASRPVMLLGGGVIKAEASETCREFAVEREIPVVTTMPALGSFPEDHGLSLEMAGMHGTGYANLAISNCDTLIAVGTRFDDRLTGGIETFAPDAEVVHVDIDPAEISKNIYADYPLIGDADTVVSQLADAVDSSPEATKWRAQCQQWKSDYSMAYNAPDDEPVQPEFVVEALDEATSDRAIVTTGVGQHQMWACQYWTFTEPRTWVSSHGLGTMGYGLPAAIGARLAADDDQEVVCVDGDGSFLMTMQGLSVAVRENLDITVAVLNNEYIGMVRQWQDAFFEGRHAASDYDWMPEFDKLAEAFGAEGYRIDDYDEVADTIADAVAYDGPSVIDVHIDPEANVYPMVPSGGDNAQFALTEEQL
ncbi:biosynthetic-type acetolactate synthase large subunit [Natronobacterium gregoryi]|uniref:Acetolactate synthase n=2 Tax=Natronobacterium gregoryi TaxID=44930 RepID=L9XZ02_NATGS|nr:biosynthetic-type acetolactate synthase large subunit [Natronobacterium gregoryi]AFZ71347.1 acetolactate synthase, large subunit, biosynthetic type [Natronobacterium gregoryi SP2]ELY67049.1 acetolactate synthase large subunit [Natronobacterium gregoryi SP2]PLK21273.1 acetolactate synthase, large subunit, biosynthetic type [Natronobacterium gregoryi SP2]SFI85825.1 acetolactate synthase, large subunit [Natronobacterium gregoryi]